MSDGSKFANFKRLVAGPKTVVASYNKVNSKTYVLMYSQAIFPTDRWTVLSKGRLKTLQDKEKLPEDVLISLDAPTGCNRNASVLVPVNFVRAGLLYDYAHSDAVENSEEPSVRMLQGDYKWIELDKISAMEKSEDEVEFRSVNKDDFDFLRCYRDGIDVAAQRVGAENVPLVIASWNSVNNRPLAENVPLVIASWNSVNNSLSVLMSKLYVLNSPPFYGEWKIAGKDNFSSSWREKGLLQEGQFEEIKYNKGSKEEFFYVFIPTKFAREWDLDEASGRTTYYKWVNKGIINKKEISKEDKFYYITEPGPIEKTSLELLSDDAVWKCIEAQAKEVAGSQQMTK